MSARRKLADLVLPGIPVEWPELIASADPRVLDAFGQERIATMIADGEMFFQLWGSVARKLRWSAVDLFGVHPTAPALRFDAMGLIPLLHGSTVRQLQADRALIASPYGGRLTYRREPLIAAVLIWDVSPTP